MLNGSGGRLKSVKESGAAVVFASPPWGGPGYVDAPVFSLATALRPYSLSALTEGFMGFAGGFVVLFLPRTSDLNEIAAALGKGSGARSDGGRTSVVHYCMRGSSKVRCLMGCVVVSDADLGVFNRLCASIMAISSSTKQSLAEPTSNERTQVMR